MAFELSIMWKNRLVIILTFSIYIAIVLSGAYQTSFAQENSLPNISSKSVGIMKNTTGMIDDAFDALRNSFDTIFGGK